MGLMVGAKTFKPLRKYAKHLGVKNLRYDRMNKKRKLKRWNGKEYSCLVLKT